MFKISVKQTKLFTLFLALFFVFAFMPTFKAKASEPMRILKWAQPGEYITAINSVPGYWEIVESGQVCWVDAGPTDYVGQSSTFPMTLKMTALRPVYISPTVYTFSPGETLTAVSSVPGWWKVVTPNGQYGWVNAGPTSYVGQSSSFPMVLIANDYLRAYSIYPGSFGTGI